MHQVRKRLRRIRQSVQPRQYKEFYVQRSLGQIQSSTYLEIGVRDGDSFNKIRAARKVAVDPARSEVMASLAAHESFFEMTSNEFFASHASRLFENEPITTCLVDGLHTFDQSLEDVVNAARWMHPNGTILLDDCFPSTRDRASLQQTGRAWNGDVWKTMAILKATQPQWSIRTIAIDEGVGVISGFNSDFRLIDDAIINDFQYLDYEVLKRDPSIVGLTRA